MLITLRQLLDHAGENKYGIPAFNVNNLEQILAIMKAAEKTDSPVILQASRGARSYAGDAYLRHLIQASVESHPKIPICMHLDHGNAEETCISAMDNDFTSVMMDGSLKEDAKTPADYDYNAGITKKISELAHVRGVSVEGELGCLGSLETGSGEAEDGHGFEGKLSEDKLLTDPDEAEKFVKETQIDALAVAIGTSHGAYKFTRKPDKEILSIDTIKKIHAKLPKIHMVMHGSSSVPKELIDIINENGGEIKPTWGVPVEEIQEGIKYGVRKINIDTDCRLAITAEVRRSLQSSKSEFDPRKYLKPAMESLTKLCIERYEAFGTAGWAGKIKPIPLAEMAKEYQRGNLSH